MRLLLASRSDGEAAWPAAESVASAALRTSKAGFPSGLRLSPVFESLRAAGGRITEVAPTGFKLAISPARAPVRGKEAHGSSAACLRLAPLLGSGQGRARAQHTPLSVEADLPAFS